MRPGPVNDGNRCSEILDRPGGSGWRVHDEAIVRLAHASGELTKHGDRKPRVFVQYLEKRCAIHDMQDHVGAGDHGGISPLAVEEREFANGFAGTDRRHVTTSSRDVGETLGNDPPLRCGFALATDDRSFRERDRLRHGGGHGREIVGVAAGEQRERAELARIEH